ncbi:MAG: hypothetical protein N2645_17010 [Clostridia bacterium]|nr:hypothetical protein [Clostridia bacterium]
MNLNEILLYSQKRTHLSRLDDNSLLGIVIKYITNIESFILKNRNSKANKIDKLISFVTEIGVIFMFCYLLSIFFMAFCVSTRITYKIALTYNPFEIIPFNQLVLVLSLSTFLIVVFIQNRRSDINTFTIIKTAIYIYKELGISKRKLFHLFVEILIITLLWIIFSAAIFFIALQLYPVYNFAENLLLYIITGAISFIVTYIIRVELEPDEIKKILRKSIFVIASFLVTLFLAFNDFLKYSTNDSVWIVKLISILFLCVFQFNNIITIIKDIYKLIEESIEKCTNIYLNDNPETNCEDKKLIETTLSYIYTFMPNNNIKTFSEYFNTGKRMFSIAIKRCKLNREKRRQSTIILTSLVVFLIYFFSFRYIEKQLINGTNPVSSIIFIALSVLGAFIIIVFSNAFWEKKSALQVIKDELFKYKKKMLPDDHEIINSDKSGLNNVKSSAKSYFSKLLLSNVLIFVLVLFSKLLFLLNILDIRAFILIISILLIPAFSFFTKKNFHNFTNTLNNFFPKHIKYKTYKIIIRITVILVFISSFGLNLVYLRI